MPPVLKRFLVFAACVMVAWYAHRPLLGAGFLGSDAAVLEDLDESFSGGGIGAPWSVEALENRPLAAASLAFSRSIHAKGGVYTPGDAGRLRLESLLILVIAVFGVRAAVIRALRPWTGEDHARAAGAAAGAFLMMHPLLVPVVAHLPARGDVVGLAASAWSVAMLLKGRQDRRAVAFGSAFVLAVIAAASSPAALLLVPLGFGLEFVASRRHRPMRARLKTGVQVAGGYSAALLLEWVVRISMRPGAEGAAGMADVGFDPAAALAPPALGVVRAIGVAAEKTGVVVLPVNTTGVGTLGYVLAVAALLAALHPGFVAARAAPRLWGRMLGGWAIAIGVLLALGITERTQPASLSDAPDTLALAVVMAIGLGISATALSGARRTVLPVITGGLYALLTAASATTINWAAAEVGELHEAILEAAGKDNYERSIWVLDPPREIAGVRALAPEHDASLTSAPFLPKGTPPIQMHGVPAASFWLLTGEPEFQRARERGVSIFLPPVRADVEGEPRETSVNRRHDALLRREVVRLDPASQGTALGPGGSFGWIGEGAAPSGRSFDPLVTSAATVVPPPDVGAADLIGTSPVIRWVGGEPGPDAAGTGGQRSGVWVKDTDGGPRAIFWLGDDPRWFLGGTVRSLWFAGLLSQAQSCQITSSPERLPAAVVPRIIGEDWTFDVAGLEFAQPLSDGAYESWVLWAVDPKSGRYAQMAPSGGASGRLVAGGAAVLHGEELVWCLDRLIDGVVVARARARRVPADAAPARDE